MCYIRLSVNPPAVLRTAALRALSRQATDWLKNANDEIIVKPEPASSFLPIYCKYTATGADIKDSFSPRESLFEGLTVRIGGPDQLLPARKFS